jgi:hypothetical protein
MDDWFDSLDSATRSRATKLLDIQKRLAADDPMSSVRSEILEDIPQTARFLLQRQIRLVMDVVPFSDTPEARKARRSVERTLNLQTIFDEGNAAFKRLAQSGADVADILRLTRSVTVDTVLKLIAILDEGYEPEASDDAPGWVVMEVSPDRTPTGRLACALHEGILGVFEGDVELQ